MSQVHRDMTSISLYGAYEQGHDDYATPRFGHPKDIFNPARHTIKTRCAEDRASQR